MGRISAEDVKMVAEGGAPQSAQSAPQQAAPQAAPLPDFSKFGFVTREPMSGHSQSHRAGDGERLEQRPDGDAV